ncbi:hypothetical protein AB0E01_40280 [Nocardia vinacea]|uniref:hypothetical protein n=1 Tax=Nocardia vinacea TaxID=96468 RepID=UPI0034015E1D
MDDELVHDSDEMRKKGGNERADSAAPYQRAEGDPDWENKIEDMFGKAANDWNQASKNYMKVSNGEYRKLGDRKVALGDRADSSASEFDNADIGGGADVRRAGPQA